MVFINSLVGSFGWLVGVVWLIGWCVWFGLYVQVRVCPRLITSNQCLEYRTSIVPVSAVSESPKAESVRRVQAQNHSSSHEV